MTDRRPNLDDLVRELRADRGPDPDWKSIDDKLFAQLEVEPKPLAQNDPTEPALRTGGRVVWIGAAVSLAAAAAALLLVRPSADGISPAATPAPVSAGAFVGGGADVTMGANLEAVSAGKSFAQGEGIDVRSGIGYFEQVNAVQWTAAGGSSLHVEHAASPLVLSLEKGAAEAQVTPVLAGEAFAIDVTSSTGAVVRVAVHGTHLRVARDGDKLTVDLTEGVVSIGPPPKRGSTIGTLVTAPAHVELDARDPVATMHVDHDAASVRPADAVSPPNVVTAEATPANVTAAATAIGEVPQNPVAHPATQKLQAQQPASAAVPELALRTPDDLGSAVKACIEAPSRPELSVTVTSTLSLYVGEDGYVQRAHFYPPLEPAPDLQDCVARAIYRRTRLSTSGDVTIPIQVKR